MDRQKTAHGTEVFGGRTRGVIQAAWLDVFDEVAERHFVPEYGDINEKTLKSPIGAIAFSTCCLYNQFWGNHGSTCDH